MYSPITYIVTNVAIFIQQYPTTLSYNSIIQQYHRAVKMYDYKTPYQYNTILFAE